MYARILDLRLGPTESAFLWGARQTGKSTLLRQAFPGTPRYDLLLSDEYRRLTARPELLRQECLALSKARSGPAPIVVVDEVQKIPELLDEIHWLIENVRVRFVLCGSSARKLKRGRANLLGGRALRYEMHPLVSAEIPDFDLVTALNDGLLPPYHGKANARRRLAAYVGDYLKEEIQAEALTRNVGQFSRFLETAALANGEIVQYANLARDGGVSAPTVRTYYEILQDTLLGRFVPGYVRRYKRRVVAAPRFYLFDVGVVGSLARRGRVRIGSELKVDFVLGDHEVAIEVKGTERVETHHLRGLRAIGEEYRFRRRVLVSCDPRRRAAEGGIEIVPWREFLRELWSGGVMS